MPFATHSFSAGSTPGAGTAITARSTGSPIARKGGDGREPLDDIRARAHGPDPALEVRGAEIGENAATRLRRVPGGSDDGDAAGREEGPESLGVRGAHQYRGACSLTRPESRAW